LHRTLCWCRAIVASPNRRTVVFLLQGVFGLRNSLNFSLTSVVIPSSFRPFAQVPPGVKPPPCLPYLVVGQSLFFIIASSFPSSLHSFSTVLCQFPFARIPSASLFPLFCGRSYLFVFFFRADAFFFPSSSLLLFPTPSLLIRRSSCYVGFFFSAPPPFFLFSNYFHLFCSFLLQA